MKRFLVYLKYAFYAIIFLLTIILTVEWVCSRIIINQEQPLDANIAVYLKSNGAHTDIILPTKIANHDWRTVFPIKNTKAQDSTLEYVGIGWGDKGFYLETPTWADLKFSTAFKAMTGMSTSALHITYLPKPILGDKCVQIFINYQQYEDLTNYIYTTLQYDIENVPIWINTSAVYGQHDAFYEAKGSYHLFKTCNTWTNDALKVAKIKSALWLAFEKQLINNYKN